jgi:hypothetical protein
MTVSYESMSTWRSPVPNVRRLTASTAPGMPPETCSLTRITERCIYG